MFAVYPRRGRWSRPTWVVLRPLGATPGQGGRRFLDSLARAVQTNCQEAASELRAATPHLSQANGSPRPAEEVLARRLPRGGGGPPELERGPQAQHVLAVYDVYGS